MSMLLKALMPALLAVAVMAGPMILADSALAGGKANWKIGRVYNRLVCNACHRQDGGKVVSPVARKKAEWQSYFAAGDHGAGSNANDSVHYYTSRDYRSAIKAENKAAAKFLKFPDAAMSAHVVEFYIHGAKDSDTPARCQ